MVSEFPPDEMDAFMAACGATGPLRLDLAFRGASVGELRSFRQPFLIIGRHRDADLSPNHALFSRRHAYLQLIGGRLFCVDLGSRTGISFPGRGGGSGWIGRSSPLEIGPLMLRLLGGDRGEEGPEDEPGALSHAYLERHALPGASLETCEQNTEPSSWPIDRALVLVGNSPLCKFQLSDDGASRFYCSLIRTRKGVWLVDLLATERVLVNGEHKRWARLEEGDELRVGTHTLRLRYDAPPPSPALRRKTSTTSGGEVALLGPSPGPLGTRPADPNHARVEAPATADLMSRLERVGQAQERMCDQFHDAMVMFSRIFGTLHRDHMDVVREELEQIRRLTEEIHALRRDGPPPPSPDPSPAMSGIRAVDSATSGAAAPADRHPLPSEAPRQGGQGGQPASPESPAERPMPRLDPREVQAIAGARLADYERERQRRWKKVLRAMMNS